MIHDGEDAACVVIDGNNGAVVTAEAFDRGLAHDRIIEGANVCERGVGECRNAAETRNALVQGMRGGTRHGRHGRGHGRGERCG